MELEEGERSMHKINIFRFNSSVNFAEIFFPPLFFCLRAALFFRAEPDRASWQRRSVKRWAKEQEHAT